MATVDRERSYGALPDFDTRYSYPCDVLDPHRDGDLRDYAVEFAASMAGQSFANGNSSKIDELTRGEAYRKIEIRLLSRLQC